MRRLLHGCASGFLLLYVFVLPMVAAAQPFPASVFARDFLPVWERAQAYTLAVAEAMPEDKYTYQPTPETFSFGAQLMHIAANLQWLNATYILKKPLASVDAEASGKTKAEIVDHLKNVFESVTQSMLNLSEKAEEDTLIFFDNTVVNKRRVFLLMRDHMTHHRAQMILYLRMNGIEPPKYVGW